MAFTAVELIEAKRDGRSLSGDAIRWLIAAYTAGDVPDYQMSAMTMAIFFNGLDEEELDAWTDAMLHSGDVLDFSAVDAPKVDKHSTGGVGDKVSICLAPLVAACGVAVPMMSGRGLGHTGGTLDKLESIPGFTTELSRVRFETIFIEHGLVLAGQSESMAPADRLLYALRDATATVQSVPLIASSIMSKKLAEGLDGLALDVKVGSGAFMKDLEEARGLAETLVDIGSKHGVRTTAWLTAMDQPLGREVGNANEVREAIDVLRGQGPSDITEVTLALGEEMLALGRVGGGRERLEEAIEDGSALAKLEEVTVAHGGSADAIADPGLLPRAGITEELKAERSGYVARCDALTIGRVSARLGAGRSRKEDPIDHGVGVTLVAKVGDQVAEGDTLAVVRFNDEEAWERQSRRLASAWEIASSKVDPPPVLLERVAG